MNIPNWLFCVLILIADCLGVISTVYQIQYPATIAFAVLFILIVASDSAGSFSALVGSCMVANTIAFNGTGLYFILMLMSVYKMFSNHNGSPSIAVILLLFLYVFHDFRIASTGVLINYSTYLLFMFVVMNRFDDLTYNHKMTTILLILSSLVSLVGAIMLTGDLSSLGDDTVAFIRLGEGDVESGMNNNLGGAMEFPITAILIITLAITMILGKAVSNTMKLLLLLITIAVFIVTFFTTSRVYLLGLAVLAFFFGLYIVNRSGSVGAKAGFVCIVLVALAVLWKSGYLSLVEYRYAQRTDSSRMEIATDCINYLWNHPLMALLGEGYRGYLETGTILARRFSMSAHNIILDCVMAFGVFGFSLVVIYGRRLYYRCAYLFDGTAVLRLMPIGCWFVMNLTNSSFMLCKTYVILPFLIIHLRHCSTLYDKEYDS